jgi:hypothetical protein
VVEVRIWTVASYGIAVSVSTIEMTQGFQVGDQVILSDMSQWDAHERVRLE